MPAATSAPNATTRMISVIGIENTPALARSSANDGVDRLRGARVPELTDEEARMRALRVGDGVEDRADLVAGLVLVAADVELDERGVLALRDLAGVAGRERRADVLNRRHLRHARDDVLDRSGEGRVAYANGAALDQDALAGRLLEAGVEDPVHAARLAGPGRVRVDVLRADRAADGERNDDEREPAETAVFQWSALQRPMRAARLRDCVCVGARHVGSSFDVRVLGRVGEGVVEGIEGTVGRDRDLELISDTRVLDRDGERVLDRVPEQQDVDAVAVAGGELAGLRCSGAHGSSFSSGRHAEDARPAIERRGNVGARPDSSSYRPTIRARPSR